MNREKETSKAAPKAPLLFSDHHFCIGNQHLRQGKPCQDYALSGSENDGAFAIVSDGCSTGRNTDIGARIVTLSAAMAIKNLNIGARYSFEACNPQKISVQQQFIIGGAKQMFGISREDLLATCVYAYLTPYGGFAHLAGDGVIAWKRNDGIIVMTRYDWDGNMPLYPIYADDHYVSFVRGHGGKSEAKVLAKETWRYASNKFEQVANERLTLEQGIGGITDFFSAKEAQQSLRFLAVFSDGVTQVHDVDWKDAVVQLLNFKNIAGDFAKRRMIRFIQDIEKDKSFPSDDIAYAVIRVNENDATEEV